MTFVSPYSTPWHQYIADANTILRTQVGSGLHGVSVSNTDDRDEMGICIEPPECVIGLRKFEQYEYRTQPQGVRSGPGDLDLVIYSLRKWARLAAAGNPTVLMPLFAPASEIVKIHWPGHVIRANVDLFLSKSNGRRFIGYLERQRDCMLGIKTKGTNRPELVDIYGFDTKYAYHAVRIGMQGVELMKTGRITLPIPEPSRSWLHGVRVGKVGEAEVLNQITALRDELERLTDNSPFPDQADSKKIDNWLVELHQEWWKE